MRETITLTTHEQKRVLVLNRVELGQLTATQAAEMLGVSERHVRRLRAAYRKEGAAALAHGNRGRQPIQTIGQEVRQRVIELARSTYQGCNQQHLRDLLQEREGITLSRSSVHRILEQAGLLRPSKRRPAQHRRRRTRYVQEGMLLQIDGSQHRWLEDRGPYLSLVAAIDDATGKLVAAVFREQEDAHGYFLLLQQIVLHQGRPLALYHDRHAIFSQTSKATEADTLEEQLAGKQDPTQFGRLLEELEISSIAAHSPQAKGRVERLFGTLQERLVIELRLAGATSMQQANQVLCDYLPRFNAQFAVPAAQEGSAYRPLQEGLTPEEVFCFKYRRTVGLDNVVSFAGHRLQIEPDQQRRSYARAEVEVHERLDGSLAVYSQQRCLVTSPAPQVAADLRARSGLRGAVQRPPRSQTPSSAVVLLTQASTAELGESAARPAEQSTAPWRPASTHPWRKPLIKSNRTKSLNI
jgi:transposase